MAADGGFQVDPVMVGFGSAMGTAILAWLGNRLVGKAAIQQAVNQTFHEQTAIWKELLDNTRRELKESDEALYKCRSENMQLRAELHQKDAIIDGFERTTVGRPQP